MMHRHKYLLDSKKSNSTEYRFVKKSGEVRYFECKTTPLPHTENYLQVVSVRDNTERKRMELELDIIHEIRMTCNNLRPRGKS